MASGKEAEAGIAITIPMQADFCPDDKRAICRPNEVLGWLLKTIYITQYERFTRYDSRTTKSGGKKGVALA